MRVTLKKKSRVQPTPPKRPTSPWVCAKCGPVSEPFHGSDEQFHCPSLECDLVVTILSYEERNTRVPNPYKRNGQAVPPATPDMASPKVDGRGKGREGRCSMCKHVRWLLRKGEHPACMSCWRAEQERRKKG